MLSYNDTIIGCATGASKAAIAIIRLSGFEAIRICDRFVHSVHHSTLAAFTPRTLINCTIEDKDGILDHILAVLFLGPNSYTGEDCIELHIHGNPFITETIIQLAISNGARLAEPGEFTRRAFFNGKMDLTQVEALSDVLTLESHTALTLSQKQLHGDLSKKLADFRSKLIHFLGLLELEFDFQYENVSLVQTTELHSFFQELTDFCSSLVHAYQTGVRLKNGPHVLLLGSPNSGKSSLFNALIGFNRSIVSETPGTTRDYIEHRVYHNGEVFHFIDSAGLRETLDHIESHGIQSSLQLIQQSDLVLYLIDSTDNSHFQDSIGAYTSLSGAHTSIEFIPVLTKVDLPTNLTLSTYSFPQISIYDFPSITALLDLLHTKFNTLTTDVIYILSQRQLVLLQHILQSLQTISFSDFHQTDVLSFQIRELLVPISELSGEVTNDDILNSVFSNFCIGK